VIFVGFLAKKRAKTAHIRGYKHKKAKKTALRVFAQNGIF
jgi:hypothetical protein